MKLPIHREGWPFIAAFVLGAAALSRVSRPLGWAGGALSVWCVWFFRDPERDTPPDPGLVVSPADGRVLPIVRAAPPAELGMGPEPRTKVSIFMNVFDVHVNRAPVDGRVVALAYRPGKFFNASFDKASEHNERMAAWIRAEGPSGPLDLAVVQIAGLVARRIKCDLREGQGVRRGERYGIIRFGSRLDVYLPEGVAPAVSEGERVTAGASVIAVTDPPQGGAGR